MPPSTCCGMCPGHLPDHAPALSVRPPAKPPSTCCGTHPSHLPHVRTQGMCRPQPTHPHTDRAPALSVRPPATHLTSPAPSRATVTPPIAWTHTTPCADCPHRHSPSSSRPVMCHAVPAPAARRKPNPAVCPPAQPLHSPTCHLPNTCHPPTVRASHCTCRPPC